MRVLGVLLLLILGCREGEPIGPGAGGAFVRSDPPGARINLDGRNLNLITPDTVYGLGGRHELVMTLQNGGFSYRYGARIQVSGDSVHRVNGPLVLRCSNPTCYGVQSRFQSFETLRFARNALGTFFLDDGTADGLIWPRTARDSYVSTGMPMFAARAGGDSVSLGIYDLPYLAGRPVDPPVADEERFSATLDAWVIPTTNRITLATVRGLRITQRLVAHQSVPDAMAVRITWHNISSDSLYLLADPVMPPAGASFTGAYIGYGLDADIGAPQDDRLSYAPEVDMVFGYDGTWQEPAFDGAARTAPGLVGLTVLESPPGTRVVLNGWQNVPGETPDWGAGRSNEFFGLRMMSGQEPYEPEHPSAAIGHTPAGSGDIRLLVAAGPVLLLPGDSASLTVGIVLAAPLEGTFVPGTSTPPGDPFDSGRALATTAAALIERARDARNLLEYFDEPPALERR